MKNVVAIPKAHNAADDRIMMLRFFLLGNIDRSEYLADPWGFDSEIARELGVIAFSDGTVDGRRALAGQWKVGVRSERIVALGGRQVGAHRGVRGKAGGGASWRWGEGRWERIVALGGRQVGAHRGVGGKAGGGHWFVQSFRRGRQLQQVVSIFRSLVVVPIFFHDAECLVGASTCCTKIKNAIPEHAY